MVHKFKMRERTIFITTITRLESMFLESKERLLLIATKITGILRERSWSEYVTKINKTDYVSNTKRVFVSCVLQPLNRFGKFSTRAMRMPWLEIVAA